MNTRRIPPSGAPPPPYAFVNRIYGRSLRPIVIAFSVIGLMWAAAWTYMSFKELSVDDNGAYPNLTPLAIVQGVLYSIVLAIEIFGIYGTVIQRVWAVRLYAFLSSIAGLLVVAVGLMRSITHFTYKNDLIQECVTLAQGGEVDAAFGIWGTEPSTMSEFDAQNYCNSEWSHDSWNEIVATVFEIILSLLFTSIAFAYYRQVVDPSSPVNAMRTPSNQARLNNFPTHYSPPYNSGYEPAYAPPPGLPPFDNKPPEYSYARSSYLGHDIEKDDDKEDAFADYEGPSVPRPLHFAEERDVGSRD